MKVAELKNYPKPKDVPDWERKPPFPLNDYQRGLQQGIFDGIMDYNELLKQIGELDLPRVKLDKDKVIKIINEVLECGFLSNGFRAGIANALCKEGTDIWEG